jgi:hypothetical protein
MTTGLKVAIGFTLALALAFGVEVVYIHYDRAQSAKPAAQPDYGPTDPDDLVYLKREHPDSMADMKALAGRTLWVQAAGQIEYFAADGTHANYAEAAGTLPGAEPLAVQGAFQQVRPKGAVTRVPAGSSQVLLEFTLPKSADAKKEYAVPVGYRDATGYTLMTDDIFFYQDPHKLYDYWGPKIWQAIDAHKAIAGMNERQAGLALGQVAKSDDAGAYGNRVVTYANSGHPMAITFVNNKATAVRPAEQF